MSASVTLMVQVAPSFEACQKPGPLDSYPVWVVAMVVMLPSLLVASLEPLLAALCEVGYETVCGRAWVAGVLGADITQLMARRLARA